MSPGIAAGYVIHCSPINLEVERRASERLAKAMIKAISNAKLVITYKSCSEHKAVVRNEEDYVQTESHVPAEHCMNIQHL